MSNSDCHTIIVCIGNELIADDAAGFEIYTRLQELFENEVSERIIRLEFCGLGGIDIFPLMEGETDMIVVDAVQFGNAPGTIHIIPCDSLPLAGSAISAHGLGLRETIEIGKILHPEKMPERITLVGIEGRCFNRTREYMTDEVRTAIGSAVTTIVEIVSRGQNYECITV
ncbi:MAG: hydrogenase maturation protease [Desulfuromonadaceae bacterium]|nr:hydrogenase maturation protease [Desulfuromonadaceae bacterium]